jgi:hypothetical protein
MLSDEWRKSTRSGDNGNCVEARHVDGVVEVRESDQPAVVLRTSPEKWAAFIAGVKGDEFDL